MKPNQERVKQVLVETIVVLCRNSLQFSRELKVQGLLGITLDDNEVFLIHIDKSYLCDNGTLTKLVTEKVTENDQSQANSACEATSTIGYSQCSSSVTIVAHHSNTLSSTCALVPADVTGTFTDNQTESVTDKWFTGNQTDIAVTSILPLCGRTDGDTRMVLTGAKTHTTHAWYKKPADKVTKDVHIG
jgi:hypothetical protein